MKKLNNAILNNIVETFVKRKKYKERKKLSWFKFTPIPIFFISIIEAYALLKNKSMKKNIVGSILFISYRMTIIYTIHFMISLLSTLGTVILLNTIYKWNISNSQFFYIQGIFILILDLIVCNFIFNKDGKLAIINMDQKLHEEKVFSEMLTKEDFELIIKSFDDRIIKKMISDNKKDGLSYGDLIHLDELLRNKQETLNKINKKEFEEIFNSLNKDGLLKKLKGKNKIEMIQYFKNLGIEVKNENKIIEEEKNGFYSRIKPIKEDHKKRILKEGSLKKEKEELLISI